MRLSIALIICSAAWASAAERPVTIVAEPRRAPRIEYGIERLSEALKQAGYRPTVSTRATSGETISVGVATAAEVRAPASAQGFHLKSLDARRTAIAGADPSGVLYGALELAARVKKLGRIPRDLDVEDAPKFVLRGPNIGMQKTEITYDGAQYDYRYTEKDFPFFYDRARWTRYLDRLLDQRMNTLYLWNGHPFTSLLKLPKYPDAQELSDAELNRNIEMFRWLTAEADRRGIWVIQFFYNIHISHALARSRGVPFQHSTPTPLTSEYTRYCISEFIRNYPNVGLLMTLGEALAPRYGPEWLAKTIIPGVKDGMAAAGIKDEPPIIVRAHATDIERAIPLALQSYKNIYTMHKWNGESLTWTDVRGDVRTLHEKLVKLGGTHIANVHLLSNLEPFRWGAPSYIQQVMQSCERLGIRGLHLYPLRYWEWPVSADNPPLEQMERDWIWFEAWGRYAWNPDRDPAAEKAYWTARMAEKYGSREAGAKLLDAYESAGISAPMMIRRIGITEGNRQAFALGMLMTQLINPDRYNAMKLLWLGDGPEGERLEEWARKEWMHQPHVGETPPGVADEAVTAAHRAVAAAEAAGPDVRAERAEYLRLLNDLRAIETLMLYYRARTQAAAKVLRYGYSRDVADLEAALKLVEASVGQYRHLVELTDKTYRQACALHTGGRKIPFPGGPNRYTHWRDCLPEYEKELATFRANVRRLAEGTQGGAARSYAALKPVDVKLVGSGAEMFTVEPGAKLYTDGMEGALTDVAPELRGLRGIRVSNKLAVEQGARLEFDCAEPVQILVGVFRNRSSRRRDSAVPPIDEWEPIFRDGAIVKDQPRLTVWAHKLPAGRNDLDLGKGAFVVLGFVRADADLRARIVFPSGEAGNADLDWLFE
jgi:hypothetical protein